MNESDEDTTALFVFAIPEDLLRHVLERAHEGESPDELVSELFMAAQTHTV